MKIESCLRALLVSAALMCCALPAFSDQVAGSDERSERILCAQASDRGREKRGTADRRDDGLVGIVGIGVFGAGLEVAVQIVDRNQLDRHRTVLRRGRNRIAASEQSEGEGQERGKTHRAGFGGPAGARLVRLR